jgi:hypothetical protein
VSPVKYELGFYTPEDDILRSDRRENLRSSFFWLPSPVAPQTNAPFPADPRSSRATGLSVPVNVADATRRTGGRTSSPLAPCTWA